jgi:hypothetical protein
MACATDTLPPVRPSNILAANNTHKLPRQKAKRKYRCRRG